jgi:hypothetical protein
MYLLPFFIRLHHSLSLERELETDEHSPNNPNNPNNPDLDYIGL